MKVIVYTVFDSGRSYGFDDFVFEGLPDLDTHQRARLLPFERGERTHPGITNHLGEGLVIRVGPAHQLVRAWYEAALRAAPRWLRAMERTARPLAKSLEPILMETLRSAAPSRMCMRVNAAGATAVRLEFDDIPADRASILDEFYRSYEWSGYTPEISSAIHGSVRDLLVALRLWDSPLARDTRRDGRTPTRPDEDFGTLLDLFPSFGVACLCTSAEATDDLRGVFREKINYGKEPMAIRFLHTGMVYFDWGGTYVVRDAKAATEPGEDAHEHVPHLLEVADIYSHTLVCFDSYFAKLSNEMLFGGLEDRAELGVQQMHRIRALGALVIARTDFGTSSQSDEDRVLWERYEKSSRLGAARRRLESNADFYHSALQDVIQQRRERFGALLNATVGLMTCFTLVSVAADLVGGVNFDYPLPKAFYRRLPYVALIPVLGLSIIIVLLLEFKYGFIRRARRARRSRVAAGAEPPRG